MKKKNRVWRYLYKLHRYIGLLSAVVLLMLAITGIALNHTEGLQLDRQMIQSRVILDWYGIESPNRLKSFSTTNHWLSEVEQQVYFDQKLLNTDEHILLGAVETDEFIVAAMQNSLVLLSVEGEIIEQSSISGIEKIGLGEQQKIVIKSSTGVMSSGDGLLSWHPHKKIVKWSEASQTPDTIRQRIQNKFRSSILPLERVLLDLHSGRLFGNIGVIIVDITGVLLIILALSGCTIWLKHKLRSFHFFPKP